MYIRSPKGVLIDNSKRSIRSKGSGNFVTPFRIQNGLNRHIGLASRPPWCALNGISSPSTTAIKKRPQRSPRQGHRKGSLKIAFLQTTLWGKRTLYTITTWLARFLCEISYGMEFKTSPRDVISQLLNYLDHLHNQVNLHLIIHHKSFA